MGSGCGDPIGEWTFLRPPGKLPVPVALNAGSPTLFTANIHHPRTNVNGETAIFGKNRGKFFQDRPPFSPGFPEWGRYNEEEP